MKTIIWSNPAAKQLDALPAEDRAKVEAALMDHAISGAGDVKKLKDRPGYRLRVGRCRVIFAEDGTTILAICIRKRDSATYRRN